MLCPETGHDALREIAAAAAAAALLLEEALTVSLGQTITLYDSLFTIQAQINSSAAIILQNQHGLDMLGPAPGGICVMLLEECCFGDQPNRSSTKPCL